MKIRYFLNIIFGIQLLAASIWCFYYFLNWIGLILLALSSFIIVPLIYRLLTKKISKTKACCLIFLIYFNSLFGIFFRQMPAITPSSNANIAAETTTANNPAADFDKALQDATQPCLSSYDKAFSKSLTDRNEQCNLISQAQNSCIEAQGTLTGMVVPEMSSSELANLFNGAKSDLNASAQAWATFFKYYYDQCNDESYAIDAIDAKLQMANAIKSMYLADVKLKKAKTIGGY